MAKELVISANRHETKLAILEDEELVEVHFQRANEYSLAGSIHKGRVTRVLPGMQSAFVDIGLERDAFLYVSDFFEQDEDYEPVGVTAEAEAAERAVERVAPTEAAAPQPAEPSGVSGEAADRRDRGDRGRSRRSRRRRTHGQGFPESKYASDMERLRRPEDRQAPREFAVLPGESLAKYRHLEQEQPSEVGELEAGEATESLESAEPAEAGVLPAPEPEPADFIPPEESEAESAELDSETEAAGETELSEGDQAVSPPFESAAAVQPQPAEALQAAAEPRIEEAAQPVETEPPPAEQDVEAPPAGPEAEAEEAPELGEATGAHEPGQGELASEQEAGPAEESSEAEPASEPPPAPEVEPARMPVSLTATLREQGLRYMHRTSRRMRRKNRGAFAEARLEQPRRAAEPVSEGSKPDNEARAAARTDRPPQPSITELLREGQEVLVQIAKEPLGQKGARITSHIALPGRYVVYMPTVEHNGVSRKIASDEERARLKRIIQKHRNGMPGGFIVRTAGEGRSEQEIVADMQFLYNLWLDIRQKAESKPAPALIHHDLDLVSRTLRDQLDQSFKAIWTDNEEVYESILRFVQRFQPSMVNRVKLYTRSVPIFDAFNVSAELEKALRPKVWLKSGGYIVINQTEALVAIDVNTGKFVGGKSNRLEDTIVKTNLEAVKEIARQIRLRDLGGIIVIDFIDMEERKNRQKVMQALEEAMRADRAPNKVLQFNDFGLVAITRKRVKQSLERALCAPCPYCEGSGYVKSVQTVIGEIIQEAHKIARAVEGREVVLRVNPEVAKVLKSPQSDYLEELEEILGRPVLVASDPTLQQEKFDLA